MIELRGVNLTFNKSRQATSALRDVNLLVEQGEFVVLFGPSGSGKTTLLGVIGGLLRADSGDIRVAGRDVSTTSDDGLAQMRLADVGVVFQENNLIEEFTALENVQLSLRLRGVAAGLSLADSRSALDTVGIGALADRRPNEMSGGQRQRVGIARAAVGGRRILLADEPTGALDADNARSIFELFARLAQAGVTVVVASHDPSIRAAADRLIHINNGRTCEESMAPV